MGITAYPLFVREATENAWPIEGGGAGLAGAAEAVRKEVTSTNTAAGAYPGGTTLPETTKKLKSTVAGQKLAVNFTLSAAINAAFAEGGIVVGFKLLFNTKQNTASHIGIKATVNKPGILGLGEPTSTTTEQTWFVLEMNTTSAKGLTKAQLEELVATLEHKELNGTSLYEVYALVEIQTGANSVSDSTTVKVTETTTVGVKLSAASSETVHVAEATSTAAVRSSSEAINVAESTKASTAQHFAESEVLIVEVTTEWTKGQTRSSSETVKVAESTTATHGESAITSETISVAESTRLMERFGVAASETIHAAEATTASGGFTRFAGETVHVAEATFVTTFIQRHDEPAGIPGAGEVAVAQAGRMMGR